VFGAAAWVCHPALWCASDLPRETDLIGEQLPPNDLPVAPGYGAKLQLKGLVRWLVSPNADDCPAGIH